MRKHLSLLLIGYLLGILIYSFVNFNALQSSKEFYLSGLLGVLILYFVVFSNSFLNQFIPFKRVPGLRILAGIIWNWILGHVLFLVFFFIYNRLHDYLFSQQEKMDIFIKMGILLFCTAILYNIVYFALYSYDNYARGQVMELRLERKQAELQLMMLKSQLSPHFLFNNMNSLASLFQKDIEKAETFIRALGNSYQFTLNNYKSNLVTLNQELSLVNSYLFLIKTRFDNGVTINLQLDYHVLDSKIPPLTLQLLIENAIKHNAFDKNKPLNINITSENKRIIVSNTKTKKKEQLSSTKVGLKNIISRYELLSDRKVEILDGHYDFTVKIPLIK
ncbi:sensor histidine kinase [Croceitalea rosinachiae]|uniref:Histidine kinase n=1 Tax=Croceitalea rosinachiae TaxID=3075596 RepID=A0ABU3ACQ4_9FLAO|nr:histidine kinase [Croceitalea sp. F388]MDT0607580.1 histidine kinase [Croceitalea sp. F388]